MKKEAEAAKSAAKKEAEAAAKQINKLTNDVRRMTRKKRLAAKGMLLTHSDGSTTKLYNVSNVHR